jgi:hypothetical protein
MVGPHIVPWHLLLPLRQWLLLVRGHHNGQFKAYKPHFSAVVRD